MTTTEPVSVIIPTYNRARLVVRAIRSALAAMRPEDELIVVDDGSTDITYEVLLQMYGSPDVPATTLGPTYWWLDRDEQCRFTYVRIDNSGPGAARNAGIARAKSPLLAFLDSDDVWPNDSLELRRRVMEVRPELVCAFGDLRIKRKDGTVQHEVLHWVHRYHPRVGSESAPSLRESLTPIALSALNGSDVYVGDMRVPEMHTHWILSDAALVRRSLAPDWRFPEDVRLLEDYEAFAQLSKLGPCAYIDTELAEIREDAGERLTEVQEIAHHDARIHVLERVFGSEAESVMSEKRRLRERIQRGQRMRSWLRSLKNALS